jgi:hypothetical protein
MVAERTVTTSRDNTLLAAAASIRAGLFPKQRCAVADPALRKAILCPRRAGKSWCVMSYAFETACRIVDARVVICMLVLKQAKLVYWPLMKSFAKRYGIECEWHLHDMTVTLPNGSTILLIGCESLSEVEKLRGQAFDLVIVDECKSFNPSIFNELIYEAVEPTLDDRDGSLVLIGTPGDVLRGLFYQATMPGLEIEVVDEDTGKKHKRPFSRSFNEPEGYWTEHPDDDLYWSRHNWTRQDNVYLPKLWAQALRKKKLNRWADDHPTWQREYLARWVRGVGSHVYRYLEILERTNGETAVQYRPDPTRQHGLPGGHEWRFICGMDFGFEDDFALVVAAYSMTDGSLYHVYDWKKNHQDIFQIAAEIGPLMKRFGGFDAMVGDAAGLGLTLVETLNKNFGFYIEKAEKREKYDYIELLNSDFLSGRIKIIPRTDLHNELVTLQWQIEEGEDKAFLARTGKLKENPEQPNHLCDALLYLHRYSHHFWGKPRAAEPEVGSPEHDREQTRLVMERMVRARAERTRADNLLLPKMQWFLPS